MKTRTRTRTGMTDWGLERERRPRRYFGGKQKHLANRLRYVDESSYSESHQGKCLSKNFVTSLYFSTAMKLFPMKSFCYFTIVSSPRIQIFPMKTINGLIWILWTPRSAKQSSVSTNTISLALLQPSNYHRCLNASRGVFATTWKAYAYSSNELPTHADSVIWFRDLADRFLF